MDGPPERVGPTGIPRRKEPPRHPSAGHGAVGRQVAALPRRGATQEGGGMVQWHTTSHPRAIWKPSGSNWSLGRATGPCAGKGTEVEAQHRHGQLGLEVPSCSSWEGGVHHQWRSRMQRPLTPGNSRVDTFSLISRIFHCLRVKPERSRSCRVCPSPLSGHVNASRYCAILGQTTTEPTDFSSDPRTPPMKG